MPTVTKVKQLMTKRFRAIRKLDELNHQFASIARQISLALPPKFQFHERVVVLLGAPEVFGKSGSVLGRAQCDDGTWRYAVFVAGPNETWDIAESDLDSLGTVDKHEDFYGGQSVRVQVGKTGRGALVRNGRQKRRPAR